MKRRTFLTAVAATAVMTTLAYSPYSSKEEKELALFKRFFKTATTFEPNAMQLIWFTQYRSGEVHKFIGERRSGMTTFMLVLALFEKKVLTNNVALFPQYHAMYRNYISIVGVEMESRLGKSINDGKIFWGWDHERFDSEIRGHRAKGFFMADHGLYTMDTPKRLASLCAPKESLYYFGTKHTLDNMRYAADGFVAHICQ